MEQICPLCNGLQEIDRRCPKCGKEMLDGGRLQDFYEPYSPYLDDNLLSPPKLALDNSLGLCMHLIYCPRCGEDQRIIIKELYI